MKQLFVIGLSFILCLLNMQTSAQTQAIQDPQLQQLIQQAVSNYSKVKELEILYKSNDVNDEIIKSNWLPEVSADASYHYSVPSPSIDFCITLQVHGIDPTFLIADNIHVSRQLNLLTAITGEIPTPPPLLG